MKSEEMKDIVIECQDCHKEFIFSVRDQLFYQEQGFDHQPKRCRDCRDRRKKERASRDQQNSSTEA